MFNNPGQKLKTFAVVFFWVVTIASVILAITLGIETRYHSYYYSYGGYETHSLNPMVFFPLIIGGPLSAYVSALCLFGFGELIENSAKITSRMVPEMESGDKVIQKENVANDNSKYNESASDEATLDETQDMKVAHPLEEASESN